LSHLINTMSVFDMRASGMLEGITRPFIEWLSTHFIFQIHSSDYKRG
jgi:hypothetical protein